ncbi:hypothetical protein ACH5RR_036922 [Cinchona calisaya]|uniref:Reverse transcriptase domain-containing protein n=1 Tax=Cinchona calisaya TaxID=153742 RepID=A0ABD2YA36_9GENT
MGYFKSSCGVKQGDPLSPLLFILASEVLSHGLISNMETQKILTFSILQDWPVVSHLVFADDVLIFTREEKRSLEHLMEFLPISQRDSGQRINYFKSSSLLSPRCPSVSLLLRITGMRRGSLPFVYLGSPIILGRKKIQHFAGLVEKFQAKLSGWRHNRLSLGNRLIPIKHVLTSIPTHILTVLEPPKELLNQPKQLMSNLF